VIGVPLITPFMYVPATLKCTRMEDYEHKPSIGISSKMAFFMIDYRIAYVNNFITVCMTTIGLIIKAQIKLEIVLPCAAFLLIFTTFLLHRVNKCDDEYNKRCFKHAEEKSGCTECAQRYGVYMKSYNKLNFKQLEMCKKHQLVCPCPICSKYQQKKILNILRQRLRLSSTENSSRCIFVHFYISDFAETENYSIVLDHDHEVIHLQP
jgi:hypothetical protein